MAEIAVGNPRFRRMYRFVPMISAEEISLPKARRCLRFKCNSFYELNAVNTLLVHDLSAVNDCILRFKYSSTTAQPYLEAEADKKILRDLLETVPSNGSIRFLRTNNFAGFSFDLKRLKNIEEFLYERDGPEHEFLDSELEMSRRKFRKECDALLEILSLNTWSTERGFQSVPQEWEWENPKRFKDTVNEIQAAAKAVCTTYDELVRFARKQLAV